MKMTRMPEAISRSVEISAGISDFMALFETTALQPVRKSMHYCMECAKSLGTDQLIPVVRNRERAADLCLFCSSWI